jgi:hypothetical protein
MELDRMEMGPWVAVETLAVRVEEEGWAAQRLVQMENAHVQNAAMKLPINVEHHALRSHVQNAARQ